MTYNIMLRRNAEAALEWLDINMCQDLVLKEVRTFLHTYLGECTLYHKH